MNATDISEKLFKVDTYYLTEQSAIEYAMSKLESAKKETMDHFDKLLQDAMQISAAEHQDTSLVATNNEMNANIEKIQASKKTYEGEMQVRFQTLVENLKKLNFRKIKLFEDLDFMLQD